MKVSWKLYASRAHLADLGLSSVYYGHQTFMAVTASNIILSVDAKASELTRLGFRLYRKSGIKGGGATEKLG